ncbi:hypothetical protein Tco_0317500 [Tanacetum coccineum]
MLAPRNRLCISIHHPGNSQGSGYLPGSPSFLGKLVKMTVEQCSFIGVRADRVHWKLSHFSKFLLFPSKVLRVEANFALKTRASDMVNDTQNEAFSVWPGSIQKGNNGSKTGVVIGSGPTGWLDRVRYFVAQEGALGPLSPRVLVHYEEVGIGGRDMQHRFRVVIPFSLL